MIQELNFPDFMTDQRRWMSRTRGTKLPFSALPETPEGVEDPKGWRYSWNDRKVWADFPTALVFMEEEKNEADGLCYVLHPAGDNSEQLRLVCLDFDKCINDEGVIDPEVGKLLESLDTFVESSVSGRGVHAFILVKCKPFKNALQRSFGGCKVDVLCSSQVAVTGTIYNGYSTLGEVPFSVVEQFQVKEKELSSEDMPDIWSEEFEVDFDLSRLQSVMENWEPCYRSSKGSQLGAGGDVEMFHAMTELAREGVTGNQALDLAQYVPQDPPFEQDELKHKIESAYRSVAIDEDDFGGKSAQFEFDVVTDYVPPTDEEKVKAKYGFTPIKLSVLDSMDLEVGFAVEGLLVDKESLFIGGREKSFKTGIAADLALSLTTKSPFLNKFNVLGGSKKVAFFTAEIGLRAAKNLFNRICRSKGISPSSINDIDIIDSLPSFQINQFTNLPSDPNAIRGLKQYFKDAKPNVAVFDPLYLAMSGAAVGDMYAIGAVLNNMNSICREFDVWPVFCHHAKKDNSKEFEAMQLTDFYGSGVSAFARQWVLMSHAEKFQDGIASLYCNAGGSAAGDCGLWRVTIKEGKSDELLDRKWDVEVHEETEEAQIENAEEIVLNALRYFGTEQTLASIEGYVLLKDKFLLQSTLKKLVMDGKANMSGGKYQISAVDVKDDNEEQQY